MTAADAADVFEKIALLMELKGENPFKTRIYYTFGETSTSGLTD